MRYCDVYSTRSLQWLYLRLRLPCDQPFYTRIIGPPIGGKHTQVPKSFTNLKRLKSPLIQPRKILEEKNLEQKVEKMEKNGKVASNAWFWGRIRSTRKGMNPSGIWVDLPGCQSIKGMRYANSTLRQISFLIIWKWVNIDIHILYTCIFTCLSMSLHSKLIFSKLLINFTVTAPENHCGRIPQLSSTYNLGYSQGPVTMANEGYFSRSPH